MSTKRKSTYSAYIEIRQIEWLEEQPEPGSELVRKAIDQLQEQREGDS